MAISGAGGASQVAFGSDLYLNSRADNKDLADPFNSDLNCVLLDGTKKPRGNGNTGIEASGGDGYQK